LVGSSLEEPMTPDRFAEMVAGLEATLAATGRRERAREYARRAATRGRKLL
jgi:hypothetical protein